MSKTLVCDICEKNISLENSTLLFLGRKPEKTFRIINTYKGVFEEYDETVFDICEECFNAIKGLADGKYTLVPAEKAE